MSNLSTLPKGDSAWLLRKAIERIIQQVSVLETNIGASTTGNSANTQVIFNDNGTLRGDPDLTFNTSLNKLVATNLESTTALVVGGSATITGDLTVDTNVLKVDSTLNKVGIGVATLTGLSTLNVAGDVAITSDLVLKNGSGTAQGYIFGSSGINYRVIASNPHVWQEGGTDLMRLNSTGLGIGVSPTYKIDVSSSSNIVGRISSSNVFNTGFNITNTTASTWSLYSFGSNDATLQNSFGIYHQNGTSFLQITQAGNVGIGVTPTYKLQSVGIAAATSSTFNGSAGNLIGAMLNSDDANSGTNPGVDLRRWTGTALNHGVTYIATNATGDTLFYNGTAASNTRATSLKMTLDASGRLGIGTATAASALSFPIGTVTAVGMTATTAHLPGNVSTLKFGVNDGGGDFGGVYVFNTHDGTYSSSEVGLFTGAGGVSVPTQRLRVDKTGNVSISTGNVVIATSSKGIDFSAVTGGTGTATGNVLNDYEEGTFTPTIVGTTTAGVGVYTGQNGKYTKVGNLVTFQVFLDWSAHTGTGNMRIGNLPFTNGSSFWAGSLGYLNGIALTAGNIMTGYVEASQSYVTLQQTPTGGGTSGGVPIDTAGTIIFSASYTV